MAEVAVDDRRLLKTMRWWDGFVVGRHHTVAHGVELATAATRRCAQLIVQWQRCIRAQPPDE